MNTLYKASDFRVRDGLALGGSLTRGAMVFLDDRYALSTNAQAHPLVFDPDGAMTCPDTGADLVLDGYLTLIAANSDLMYAAIVTDEDGNRVFLLPATTVDKQTTYRVVAKNHPHALTAVEALVKEACSRPILPPTATATHPIATA